MAIADDFSIDYVNRRITYTGTFSNNIAPTRYTVNELYSYLQDTFDEPAQMDDPVPMSAQTPTQYTLINRWFMDDETVKALYSGSIQTSNWTYSASAQAGITQLWYSTGSPTSGDIGTTITDSTTSATGVILAVDTTRKIVWVRNTNGTQFGAGNSTTGVVMTLEADSGAQQGVRSGETVWTNAYSVGTIQNRAEIYLAQENEWHGGGTTPVLTKLTSWWDTDTDFTASTNGVSAGHIDVLVKVRDAGVWIDDLGAGSAGRVAAYVRQGGTVYSHFEFLGAVGNYVIPFASTGYDINVNGFYSIGTGAFSHTPIVGEVITGVTSGAKAIVTAYVTDTSIEYQLLGKDLTDFQSGEVIQDPDTNTIATTSGTSSAANGATVSGVTVTFSATTADVDQDGSNESYACTVNCNSNSLSDVYEYLMYLTRRGSTSNLLPEPGAGFEDAEFYRGIGDQYITLSAVGVALTEGQTVTNGTATGELVATDNSSWMVLTNVKGTFAASDTVTDEGSGSVTVGTTIENLVDVNSAPFGTFAGGRFFVARGVLLTNVPAADNNNWQTSTVAGVAKQPPTTISLTLAGLTWQDRGVVLEVATNGGIDVVKTTVGVEVGALGGTSITLDETVQQDVPSTGWIRVVDTSEATNGTEYRYEFSSITGSGVTLRTVTAGTGTATATAANSGYILESTGVGFDFGVNGKPKVGHQIRNTTTGEFGVVLRTVTDDQIETSVLPGAWSSGDTYEINKIVVAIAADDTCYFPFIDDVCASGQTSLAKSLKYAADTEILARARFSDPDIGVGQGGGTRILPFELLGQTITNSDLTITAIRTTDPIAT